MKVNTTICLILILVSCKPDRDGGTNSIAYWVNETSHSIKIESYSLGNVRQDLIVTLTPGDSLKIADDNSLGKQGLSGFTSKYLIGSDSVSVQFDSIYSVSHYVNEPLNKSKKYYPYQNVRNILWIGSYQARTTRETSISMWNEYRYVFTEQDYLDAQ